MSARRSACWSSTARHRCHGSLASAEMRLQCSTAPPPKRGAPSRLRESYERPRVERHHPSPHTPKPSIYFGLSVRSGGIPFTVFKIPSEVVTGSCAPRPSSKRRFEALTHQNGFCDSSGLRLPLQLRQKFVR